MKTTKKIKKSFGKSFLSLAVVAAMIGGVVPMTAFADDKPGGKSAAEYAADNTGKNKRDVHGATKTPEDQSEKEGDRKITQNIRSAIEKDDSFSVNGKNVKIITRDGKVTLRGPVNSIEEKQRIREKARQAVGVTSVDDQLEVVPR